MTAGRGKVMTAGRGKVTTAHRWMVTLHISWLLVLGKWWCRPVSTSSVGPGPLVMLMLSKLSNSLFLMLSYHAKLLL